MRPVNKILPIKRSWGSMAFSAALAIAFSEQSWPVTSSDKKYFNLHAQFTACGHVATTSILCSHVCPPAIADVTMCPSTPAFGVFQEYDDAHRLGGKMLSLRMCMVPWRGRAVTSTCTYLILTLIWHIVIDIHSNRSGSLWMWMGITQQCRFSIVSVSNQLCANFILMSCYYGTDGVSITYKCSIDVESTSYWYRIDVILILHQCRIDIIITISTLFQAKRTMNCRLCVKL